MLRIDTLSFEKFDIQAKTTSNIVGHHRLGLRYVDFPETTEYTVNIYLNDGFDYKEKPIPKAKDYIEIISNIFSQKEYIEIDFTTTIDHQENHHVIQELKPVSIAYDIDPIERCEVIRVIFTKYTHYDIL